MTKMFGFGWCLLFMTLDWQCAESYNFTVGQMAHLIKADCGEVCDTSIIGEPGKYYEVIQKEFDCEAIMDNPINDLLSNLDQPPSLLEISESVQRMFTYGNRFDINHLFMDDSKGKTHDLVWTFEQIEGFRQDLRNGQLIGLYGFKTVADIAQHIQDHMSEQVLGGHVLVIGSQVPWLEAILLEKGAKQITTLEYVPIQNKHPQVKVITPNEFHSQFLAGILPKFDAVASFSSLEHSGLGRYGDAINPWGDLITMAKTWCVTREGGRALIGVPVGYDAVLFNGCKLYGPIQLSHLFANWDQVYTEAKMFIHGRDTHPKDYPTREIYGYQPLFILEKPHHAKAQEEL